MYSQVTLMGRLGHDPELRYTRGNPAHAVCNLSVAVQPYGQEAPDWWTVTCWDQTAEFAANHLARGGRVLVVGTPDLETWEGQDGGHNTRLHCTARTVQAIDWASDGEEGEEGDATPETASDAVPASVGAGATRRQPAAAGRTARGEYQSGRAGRPQGTGCRRG